MAQEGHRQFRNASKGMATVGGAAKQACLPMRPSAARVPIVESKIDQLLGKTPLAQQEQEQEISVALQEVTWHNSKWLRFLPVPMDVHISFEDSRLPTNDAPKMPSAPDEPVMPILQTAVGKVMGDYDDHAALWDEHDVDESVDPRGLTAYIRHTSNTPNWEFCDALGRRTSEEMIWMDQDKRTLSQKRAIVEFLMGEYMTYRKTYEEWENDMRAWRIRRRVAELEFWRHQAAAQNWNIFNPTMRMPERWQDLYEGLRLYVGRENEKDKSGGYDNKYQGRPSCVLVYVDIQEIVAIEKEHGTNHPQIQLSSSLQAQAERLAFYIEPASLDQRHDRLWNVAARIVHQREIKAVTEWEVAGSVGPKPGDVPPGLSKAGQTEWAIREDEAWNERVVKEVRGMLKSRGYEVKEDMDIAI